MVAVAAIRHFETHSELTPLHLLDVARKKLIVALDFSTLEEAKKMVEILGDEIVFYKVGLGLQLAGGDQFARELKKKNKMVFLDYK